MKDEIERAIYLLGIAGKVIEEHASDVDVFYDEANCDGTCLAMDIEICLENIVNLRMKKGDYEVVQNPQKG